MMGPSSTTTKTTPTTMTNNTLTAIDGLLVGHYTDVEAATGCTVILCPPGTVGGVDQRGGAPGTRETDLLRPMHLVEHVHALVLSGGSAFGLATADGVMRYLREREIGFSTPSGLNVPIVPAAILYDLEVGQPMPPTADDGYTACLAATAAPVPMGSVGAGAGARIGAMAGNARATKGGIGSAAIDLGGGLIVAALVAVNAVGNVLDERGQILAGLRNEDDTGFVDMLQAMRAARPTGSNTVIGVLATNASLPKELVNKVAQMAHDGLARAVKPAHTLFDGDTIFALATGEVAGDVNLVGAYGAEVFERAVRAGVRAATTLGGVRALTRP